MYRIKVDKNFNYLSNYCKATRKNLKAMVYKQVAQN